MAVEPVVRLLGRESPLQSLPRTWWAVAPVGAAHLALVFAASRVAGLRTSALEAAVLAGTALGVGLAGMYAWGSVRTARERGHRDRVRPPGQGTGGATETNAVGDPPIRSLPGGTA
jgi:hypothetical protein